MGICLMTHCQILGHASRGHLATVRTHCVHFNADLELRPSPYQGFLWDTYWNQLSSGNAEF